MDKFYAVKCATYTRLFFRGKSPGDMGMETAASWKSSLTGLSYVDCMKEKSSL